MELSNAKVIIAYKNFPVAHHVSHIGLGVSALNTAKVLLQHGVRADVWATLGAPQLAQRLHQIPCEQRPTHIIISAPFIPKLELQTLVFAFPMIQFVVTCHSNVGFLQADPQGVHVFRDCLDLEKGSLNFRAAGNSKRFCKWVKDAYGSNCTLLPNLYHLDRAYPVNRPLYNGGVVRIGVFGAVRVLKNLMTAGAAILEVANNLHTSTEMHISVGRIEGGHTVLKSLREMMANVPNIRLVEHDWAQWPEFRRIVRSMHLLIQVSYTETFNMVTADGAAESIPSVVSDAIDWAPKHWKTEVDDALAVARTARNLLKDPDAGHDGYLALIAHNEEGVRSWKEYLHSTF